MGVSLGQVQRINQGLALFAGLLVIVALGFFFATPSTICYPEKVSKALLAPPTSFARPVDAYEKIDSEWLALKYTAPAPQVPDLRNVLTFYGVNGRPDAPKNSPLLHFGLAGGKKVQTVWSGEKLYLDYDKKATPPSYIFSKNNEPTPLWIEAQNVEGEAEVVVSMVNEEGELIAATGPVSAFRLAAKELQRPVMGGNGKDAWEIGKIRVDGTLLARQKTRWYGIDRFIEKHGGEEYAHAVGKHRIDFDEGPSIYSVFVEQNDSLVWNDGQWQVIKPGVDSLDKPLLHVKKIDERLISFELWDESGQRKIPMTILRANEVWSKESLQKEFHFLGARTRSQCVFEVGDQRILLKPNDWLVLTDEGWRKLETEEEIDGFVKRELVGPLFVFDGLIRRDERQVLLGTLFNAARTECEMMELAVQHGATPTFKAADPVEQEDEIEHHAYYRGY